jgi:predicted outer membrane protein
MNKFVALGALMASLATPAMAQTAPMAVPTDREGFRQMAMMSDAFEITSSQLALERSRNPRVRAYAQQMINDHAATSQALNGGTAVYGASGQIVGGTATGALAGAGVGALVGGPVGAAVGAGIGASTGATAGAASAPGTPASGSTVTGTLAGAGVGALVGGPVGAAVGAGIGATTGATAGAAADSTGAVGTPIRTAVPLDARKAAMLNQLASTSGPQFDRLYGQAQRMAHQEALAVYTAYAQNGRDPAMVQYTQSVIPHLQQHAAAARRLPGGGSR